VRFGRRWESSDQRDGKSDCEHVDDQLDDEVPDRKAPVDSRKQQDEEGHEQMDRYTVQRSNQIGVS
jgi:hypothetical protein